MVTAYWPDGYSLFCLSLLFFRKSEKQNPVFRTSGRGEVGC
ncbi:hypothetical protein M121_2437 [Bacteroides fragilis str. 3783N2-1]|nr:hypothetical protein M121_2437 [Bacteroides fragilis str. 3783N2-1]EXY55584.1 hypothetical protein M122_2383 [Bacteroides fragilis str. 3976T7]